MHSTQNQMWVKHTYFSRPWKSQLDLESKTRLILVQPLQCTPHWWFHSLTAVCMKAVSHGWYEPEWIFWFHTAVWNIFRAVSGFSSVWRSTTVLVLVCMGFALWRPSPVQYFHRTRIAQLPDTLCNIPVSNCLVKIVLNFTVEGRPIHNENGHEQLEPT